MTSLQRKIVPDPHPPALLGFLIGSGLSLMLWGGIGAALWAVWLAVR